MRDTENPFDVPVSSSGRPCGQLRPARSRGLIMLASLLKLIHVGFLSLVTIGIFYIQFFFFNIYVSLYLAVPGLSCSTWDLQSSLWHLGSLVVAFELLVAVCKLCIVACGL